MEEGILDVALDAAEIGGSFLAKNFRRKVDVKHKSPRELVSELDVASEEKIVSEILGKYPEHNVASEELGDLKKKSRFTWVVDPLDGTHNFLYGMPLYGVSIAVLEDDVPVASVINLPEFRETYAATKGGGAFLNGSRIRVSSRTLGESMLFFESQFHRKTREKLRILGGLSSAGFSVRVLGVATVSFGWVARGLADFYAIADAKLCDVAAGVLLVSEAGGMVTDFYGRPWNRYSKNIAVSNGRIHDEVLKCLKQKLG